MHERVSSFHRYLVPGAIVVSAVVAFVLGCGQGTAWSSAAAYEAGIDWDTTGGLPGLGMAIDQLVAVTIVAIGGSIVVVPAAAIVGASRRRRRRAAFASLLVVVTIALLLGLTAGSGAGDPDGFLAAAILIPASLAVLFVVTIGALVGFGIGNLVRADDRPAATEGTTPAASSLH